MRRNLLLISFCIVSLYVSSQNTILTGNVGIGTSNPTVKLDVAVNAPDLIRLGRSTNTHAVLGVSNTSSYLSLSNDGFGNGATVNLYSAGTKYWDFGLTDNLAPYSQWQLRENVSGAMVSRITVPLGGNVGIGTTTPGSTLDVNGTAHFSSTITHNGIAGSAVADGITGYSSLNDIPGTSFFIGLSGSNYAPGSGFQNKAMFGSNGGNSMLMYTDGGVANGGTGTIQFRTGGYMESNERMRITAMGNVGIGTTNPQAKLAVKGSVFAEKIKVTLAPTDWPDYVFDKNYRLRSLAELQSFIDKHHHLPEVPSADEVKNNGLDVGDNQAMLLRKIEELTLYLIEQNKKIEELQKEIKKLDSRAN